ncbi:MAG: YchJ family protein [Rhodospirillaceae bacterium]|nr:YchJ family protein [Rhodospirillaceae bacterium]
MTQTPPTPCPCNSGKDFAACCGPILDGTATAETAEALMRSRYTAHVMGNFEHVANTHAPEIQDTFNKSAAQAQWKDTEWLGLEIRETTDGGPDDETGTVTFTARFKEDGQVHAHREHSVFRRESGEWVYVDGTINPPIEPRRVEKIGRNDPCPCGSGKKYKKCCGG